MKKTFADTFRSLTYNFKTLLYFELLYRVLGLLIIFPLARSVFYLSIRVSRYAYITNRLLIDYLTAPSTIILLLFMVFLLSVYLVIEMIFLSLLYDFGYHEKSIDIKSLLRIGFRKVVNTMKKYHVLIIVPAFLFFFLVEFFHVVGVASTLALPPYLIDQLNTMPWVRFLAYVLLIGLVGLFLETVFSLNLFTLESMSFKEAVKESRAMLRHRRIKMLFEFGILNVSLNAILYLLYIIIITVIAGLIFITRGQDVVLGLMLTVIYAVYVVIGFVASIILIPVNFALMAAWYYERREERGLFIRKPSLRRSLKQAVDFKWLKRVLMFSAGFIFIINLTSVFAVLGQTRTPLEYWNYAEIVAHRGASWDAPENTLSAFENAISQGSDAMEFDVRLTRDGVPVIFHDTTLGRTTDDAENRRIEDVDYEDIRMLDAGHWFSEEFTGETIPTLEETLALIQGRSTAFIELKVSGNNIEEKTVRLIEEMNMTDSVKVMSFSHRQLEHIKVINPDIETVFLMATFYGDFKRVLNYDHVDHVAFEHTFIINNPHYIDSIHQAGKSIYVWTVNDESRLQSVVDLDVDGIITDRPVVAREIAYSKNTHTIFTNILKELFSRGS